MQQTDVIVVGGGPAGLFAAGFAALAGARVLLLEKNRRCGAKLLITGKGRCNITTSEPDPRRLVEHLGAGGKALLTALYAFGTAETIDFFQQRGLGLKVERGGRVFPAQGGAADVLKVLEDFLAASGAQLVSGCEVQGLGCSQGRLETIRTSANEYRASSVILATGGLSYRDTGCTGDGYRWARQTGHAVIKPQPALVALKLAESWTGSVSELNLKNVRVAVLLEGQTIDERFGE